MEPLVFDPNRVKTGIAGYDEILHGGYLPNSVNLISGCSGAGKTIFAMSFIYEGVKTYGEKGVYITLEEGHDQILQNCKSVGMDFSKIDPDKFSVIDLAALRKIFTVDEEFDRKDSPLDMEMLIHLLKSNAHGAQRIVVDSIVPFSLRYSDMNQFRAQLFRLRMTLKDLNATSLITTEVLLSSTDVSRFGVEDFLSDSVTVLRMTEDKGNYIKVHKIRGSDHIKEPVRYEITAKGMKVNFDQFKMSY
jgi:circadian clock protein KaiC